MEGNGKICFAISFQLFWVLLSNQPAHQGVKHFSTKRGDEERGQVNFKEKTQCHMM